MTVSARAVAAFLDDDVTGPETTVEGVDSLDDAGPNDLAFCVYEDADAVRASDAGVVVCPPTVGDLPDRTLVHDGDPKLAFVKAVDEFFVDDRDETTVHPTASVADGATIGDRCRVGPQAHVGDAVTLGDDVHVGAGAVLGEVGFGFARDESGEPRRQVHDGEVVVADGAAVGPNATVDRAVFGATRVGENAKLSGNVHLAHQVHVGENVTVACGCGFAGGAEIGAGTTVHPNVSVATDVTVGRSAELGMNAAVLDDVPAETTVVGSPARPVEGER